jgi:hypothetical protein
MRVKPFCDFSDWVVVMFLKLFFICIKNYILPSFCQYPIFEASLAGFVGR